jgi:hypothetical protein
MYVEYERYFNHTRARVCLRESTSTYKPIRTLPTSHLLAPTDFLQSTIPSTSTSTSNTFYVLERAYW